MKLVKGLLIVGGILSLLAVLQIDGVFDRISDEEAYAQLPQEYQQIPSYPGATREWRGATRESLCMDDKGTKILAFSAVDEAKVSGFYKKTLERQGWVFDSRGIISDCNDHKFLHGDIYHDAQNGYVWVAAGGTQDTFTIYMVDGPIYCACNL